MPKPRVLLTLCLLFLLAQLSAANLPSFEEATQASIHPILVLDAETGTIIHANAATAKLFSVPQERLNGRLFSSLLSLGNQSLASLQAKTVIHAQPDGSLLHLLIGLQPFQNEDGSYYMALLLDQTQQANLVIRNRILTIALSTLIAITLLFLLFFLFLQLKLTKQVQQQQQQQEYTVQLLQRFLDADDRISYVKDDDGRFIFVNAALAAFLGKNYEQLLGKRLDEVAHPDFAAMTTLSDQKVMETMRLLTFESAWNQQVYQVTKFPLILPDGKPGMGTFAQDITEAKRQDETLNLSLKRSAMLVDLLSSSIAHPQVQMHKALDKACELTQSNLGILLLIDKSSSGLMLAATSGNLVPSCRLEEHPQVLDASLSVSFRQLTDDGKPLIQNQKPITTAMQTYIHGLEGTLNTLITVPFFVDEQLAGIVLLANNPYGYDEGDGYQVQLLFAGIHTSIQKAQKEVELEASKQSLRLILDSTAEGIYGMDTKGNCTFCNASCLSILGYDSEAELLGRNMHRLIHHSTRNGKPIEEEDCPISRALVDGIGVVMDDEVFFRKDGSSFDVLCHAYPQMREGNVIGSVVTFTDNTERKANLAKIEYLSLHDQLTGLYNRAFFDDALVKVNRKELLPISIIVGDVNGLKLSNDIFGHSAGDGLLTDIADVLSNSCRKSDIVSRIGGDEFVVLLPNTSEVIAVQIVERIRKDLDGKEILAGSRALALGIGTKTTMKDRIHDVFEQAEDRMYREKTLTKTETQRQQLEVLLRMLFGKAPSEEHHAQQVQNHAVFIGKLLNLSNEDLNLLSKAGYYHDIGKVVLDRALIETKQRSPSMQRAYQDHVSAAFRILNTFEETMDIAPLVLNHHERWDGKGYLRGLKAEDIPLISRILRLAELWEREGLENATFETRNEILRNLAGTEADPNLVDQILRQLASHDEAGKPS
nr:diguanylate cyclase [uncultured Sphaerochaeta sp.]